MEHNLDLGQHFMTDKAILARIAAEVTPLDSESVIEIGSGSGNLTKFLLEKTSALTCIEFDTRLSAPDLRVTYIQDSVLSVLPQITADVVVGNIPYHISEPLLYQLLDLYPRKIVLVTGKVFAEKLTGKSIIGLLAQNQYHVELKEIIPKTAFSPPPRVESALLVLTKKTVENIFVQKLANLSKPTVKNALIKITEGSYTKNQLREKLASSSLQFLDKKVYALSTEEFLELLVFCNSL